jgi:Mg2+ and Co2+ transporter CorA
MIKDSDFDNCELTTIIDVILDEVVYYLGVKRTELFREFDELFERITEGQAKNVEEVRDLRKEIQTLYSDSSSLFYVAKKLSKFVSEDTLDNVAFAFERSEILITRSADLYNIYLTEVQNELNTIMKKLTSISFIFLPITAIASLYAVSYSSLCLYHWTQLIRCTF